MVSEISVESRRIFEQKDRILAALSLPSEYEVRRRSTSSDLVCEFGIFRDGIHCGGFAYDSEMEVWIRMCAAVSSPNAETVAAPRQWREQVRYAVNFAIASLKG